MEVSATFSGVLDSLNWWAVGGRRLAEKVSHVVVQTTGLERATSTFSPVFFATAEASMDSN